MVILVKKVKTLADNATNRQKIYVNVLGNDMRLRI